MLSTFVEKIGPPPYPWLEPIARPYKEGAARLNLAIEGVTHSIVPEVVPLKKRLVYFLVGLALVLFPLINSILWIAWEVFGRPENLSYAYATAREETPLSKGPNGLFPIPLLPSNLPQTAPWPE